MRAGFRRPQSREPAPPRAPLCALASVDRSPVSRSLRAHLILVVQCEISDSVDCDSEVRLSSSTFIFMRYHTNSLQFHTPYKLTIFCSIWSEYLISLFVYLRFLVLVRLVLCRYTMLILILPHPVVAPGRLLLHLQAYLLVRYV